MLRLLAVIVCCGLAGCDGARLVPDAGPLDAGLRDGGHLDATGGATDDAGERAPDGGAHVDAGATTDGGTTIDAGPADAGSDAEVDAGRDAGTDAGVPARSDHHVHIDVDNRCGMTVTPTEITIPAGQSAYVDWHNHSRDYPVDVWMSYGGGYTDLPPGATWDEPIRHCGTPRAHDEWADISTACSRFRFVIHCL